MLDSEFIASISSTLKDSYRGEMQALIIESIKTMIQPIVDGVLSGLQAKISVLETENSSLKAENEALKTRVSVLEFKSDEAEQYSRRNCLRISGIKEPDLGATAKRSAEQRGHRCSRFEYVQVPWNRHGAS